MVLGGWAARSPRHDPTLPISAVSIMQSFETMFDPALAGDAAMTVSIDWLAFLQVFGAALTAAVLVVGFYAIGLRLLVRILVSHREARRLGRRPQLPPQRQALSAGAWAFRRTVCSLQAA